MSATGILALSGGVGGAKLADGLLHAADRGRLTVVVNTGDDFTHLGLHISPDIDTALYTLADLANPSPALGWAHRERRSLEQRGPADALLALALVHHLAIGRNVPLDRIAEYFARLGRALVIEFVPKSDSQVQRLLRSREDVFADYHREGFEAAFGRHFRIEAAESVTGSERTMYAMTTLGRA